MNKKLKVFPILLAILMIFSCFPYYATVAASNIDIGSVRVNIENDSNIDSYAWQSPMRIGDNLHITWDDYSNGVTNTAIVSPDGTIASTPIITVSPKTNDNSDTILYKPLSSGNIVIYWYSSSSDKGLIDTYFKIVDQSWNEVVGATKINSNIVPVQYELNRFTEVAELSNGNLAFVWSVDGSNYALRRFNTDGTAVDPTQLNVTSLAGISGSQYTHSITANKDGRFMIMIAYYNPNYIGMIFDNDASTPVQVNGQNSFVISSRVESGDQLQYLSLLSNGKYLAVYRKIKDGQTDNKYRSIAYRIYNADGTPYTTEKVIRELHSWGTIKEPIILDDGFILSYSYSDLNTPGSLSEYIEHYNNEGVLQSDLTTILPSVNAEYGTIIPFLDIDGKLALLINDTENGQSAYDTWLIRHAAAPIEYTVMFMDWNGSILKTETVNPGDNATAPEIPTRTGHTFTGWDTDLTNVSANVTITAQYSANEYTVTFNSNGGSTTNAITGNFSANITAPTVPTKEGYSFEGWYKEAALTNEWEFDTDTIPANDITLYAKWTINSYNVTFEDWDGTALKVEPVNHGNDATAPLDPSRVGYTFTGWSAVYADIKASTTITAQYSSNEYTVTFNSNGGSATNAIAGNFSTKITAPTVPTKEGYSFEGWYKEVALTNEWVFDTDTIPANDITLYAKWTINSYNVTFEDWDGTALKVEPVNHGNDATAPLDPSRVGYTFTGWSAVYADIKASTTITAQYSANEYAVTFNSNGGSATNAIAGNFSTKITAPTIPTKEGHSFDGWYKEVALTNEWVFDTDTIPANDITLYAKWTINSYNVTFEDWDGTALKVEPVNHGNDATAPLDPSRVGYTFTGWSAVYADIKASTTITAQYSANEYAVTFNSNGGSTTNAIAGNFSTKITAPTIPTKEGYSFDGWYKEVALTNEWVFDTDTIPANDITLYAKWTINSYNVTFEDWDGTALKVEPVNHGNDATAPLDPSRVGYTFTGWSAVYTDIKASTTITAQYSVNEYTVSFNSNGGSTTNAITGNFSTNIAAPTVPTKEGYRFEGWYKEVALTNEWVFDTDTVPKDGITLHAKWTAVYSITYDGNGNNAGSVPQDSTGYEHEDWVTVLGNTNLLIKRGHTFAGWNTQADGKGMSYSPYETLKIDSKNVTLYAMWNRVPDAPIQVDSPKTAVEVLINGKIEQIGDAVSGKRNDQTLTLVTVDEKDLDERLAAVGLHAVLTIPVLTKSDIIIGQFNGELVKSLENKQVMIEIKTNVATYNLPAQQINIDSIIKQIGHSIALQDLIIQIEIAEPNAATLEMAQNAAKKGSFKQVVSPIDFRILAIYQGQTIEVSSFNIYVERTIAIPDAVDPKQITTGVVVESDGTVRHVPTKIFVMNGKLYAKLNSLSNSTYSIIWNNVEFDDMTNHWAKDDVNDMGSRMIINGIGNELFNPDENITRAEFATIIVRALGLKLENGVSPYSDVKTGSWYNSAINTANAYQLITGFEDGTFRPDDQITREQAMTIISKSMKITGLKANLPVQSISDSLQSFEDLKEVSTWAKSGVADTVQSGIVSGRNGSMLAPKEYITRAEVATIMKRLLQKSELI